MNSSETKRIVHHRKIVVLNWPLWNLVVHPLPLLAITPPNHTFWSWYLFNCQVIKVLQYSQVLQRPLWNLVVHLLLRLAINPPNHTFWSWCRSNCLILKNSFKHINVAKIQILFLEYNVASTLLPRNPGSIQYINCIHRIVTENPCWWKRATLRDERCLR